MKNNRTELRRITEILLKPEDDYGELVPAIHDLYQLFLTVSNMETGEPCYQEHIFLPMGKAIAPHWAGLCIRETMRTKRFIQGVYLGLKSAIGKSAGTPVRVLYAGTGPFATLAIPMTTMFASDLVQFTFIEINPHNLTPLEKIIHGFEAENYITDIIQVDATQFRNPPTRPFQMIITETMQNALQNEPQVAITMNLVKQMEHRPILIPENIDIEAVLLSPKRNNDRMLGIIGAESCYRSLGKIFELNHEIHSIATDTQPYPFPEVELKIPREWVAEYPHLCLFTRIRVFGEAELNPWECSLTQPQKILEINPDNPVERVALRYVLGEKPGFTCRVMEPGETI